MPRSSPGRFSLRRLSLRTKAFLLVGLPLLALTAAYFAVISIFLLGSLDRLQNEWSEQVVHRVVSELNQLVRQQRRTALDYAVWEDSYDFFKGNGKDYIEKNFSPSTITTEQNLVLFFDRQKNLFLSQALPGALLAQKDLPGYFNADQVRHSSLLQDGRSGSAIVGTPEGLLALSAHPVTRTGGSGPSPGWLVFGLNVGEGWFEEMRKATGAGISPCPAPELQAAVDGKKGTTFHADALGEYRVFFAKNERPETNSDKVLIGFANTIGGAPAGLRLSIPSMVSSTAVDLRNKAAWSSIIWGCILMAFSFLVIELLFIRKIARMGLAFQMLAGDRDVPPAPAEESEDEFERLAGSANRLQASLRHQHGEAENQEALLLSVLDSASEGIMAFRSLRNERGAISDFIMVLANKSAERMMNRKSGEMLGKCLLGLFPGNLSEGLFDRYVRVVETKVGEHVETFYENKDTHSWFHISVEPWSDGFVVTLEEISQRKRVEQELKASVEELERFNRAMIGRENRVLEMKSEVNLLRSRMGLPPEYNVDSLSDEP